MVARQSTARRETSDEAGDGEGTVTAINQTLKNFGVDTDVMSEAAKEKATDLQALIAEELKARPLRALGVAAGVGLFLGLLVSR